MWAPLAALLRAGESVAAATIVEARGSTPREVGATMLVHDGRAIAGSVGGGIGEARVLDEAGRALADGTSRAFRVDLVGAVDDPDASLCGGIVDVFVDCLHRDRDRSVGLGDVEAIEAIRDAHEAGRTIALAVVVADGRGAAGLPVGAKWIIDADGAPRGAAPPGLASAVREAAAGVVVSRRSRRVWLHEGRPPDGAALFVQLVQARAELVVVGAGHIAAPLVRVAKLLDFHVTVIDDRPSLATRERFADADRLVVGDVAEALASVPLGDSAHVVLVTRSHEQDEAALEALAGADPAYVGMIGSRRKVREVFRRLVARGVPDEWLARVHAPIGLPIGALTPAEIAVAIVAEVVQVRRGAGAPDRIAAPVAG